MKERTIQILKYLMSSNFPVSTDMLSNYFSISKRSVQYEIKEINLFLEKNDLPKIENIRKHGYLLSITHQNEAIIKDLLSTYSDGYFGNLERRLDLLLSVALSSRQTYLTRKEIELRVSKSTIDDDIRKLREQVTEFDIEIVSIPKKGLVFLGSEKQIRLFLFTELSKWFSSFDWRFQGVEDTGFQSIIYKYIPKELLTELDKLYNDHISNTEDNVYRKNMILYSAVWICRVSKSNWIEREKSDHCLNRMMNIDSFISKIISNLDIKIPESEVEELSFMLSTLNPQSGSDFSDWAQGQILSLKLIQLVEELTELPFSKKETELQVGLTNHMIALLGRLRYNIQFNNPLKETIKENYKIIYSAVSKINPIILKTLGKEVNEDELAFLTIHFLPFYNELTTTKKTYFRAVVICHHGKITGNLLAKNLSTYFDIEVIGVLGTRETDLLSKLDFDLIFSTIPLDDLKLSILVVDPIFSDETKTAVEKFIAFNSNRGREVLIKGTVQNTVYSSFLKLFEKYGVPASASLCDEIECILKENEIEFNKYEVQAMMKDVLKNHHILINQEVRDWEDAIKKVSSPLLEEEVITPNYVKAMINSVHEYGPYIVIGEHLALAHARPEDGAEELGLSVMTIPKGVIFNHEENDPVKIVFCLSAVDNVSHLTIMRELVNLIHDKDKLQKLILSENPEEFSKILYS